MSTTKLDAYDYMLLPGIIRISLEGTNDPILVDIFSEIQNYNNRVYVDGHYFLFLGEYEIFQIKKAWFMDLKVVEIM